MSSSNPRSWFDGLLGLCFGLLVAAGAVYVAVKLITAVWVVLVVILSAVAVLAAAVTLLRNRRGGW